MKYRLNTFYARTNHDSETTIVIDLNMKDIVSNIVIGLETVNATDDIIEHAMAIIKKIELIDGSDVLYSLDGYQAEALDWYNRGGKFRANWNWCLIGMNVSRFIGVNFGRWLWDKEYAFDPNRFTNPQLRITVDPDAGVNTPSSVYITCWANMFESSPVGLKGFLMSKEIKEYAVTADAHEYTDLPLDYPYRALYFQPFVRGTESHQCIKNLKISEDQDKRIPYNHGITDIINTIAAEYGRVEESYIMPATAAGVYLYITPTTHVTAVGVGWGDPAVATGVACYNGDGGRLDVDSVTVNANIQVHVKGDIPHAVFEIPFGLKNEPEDWYDVRGLGTLRLDIEGGATATGHIFLQQARNY
ncbi:hypothetical protein ES707_06703 [subsurface metagenome]